MRARHEGVRAGLHPLAEGRHEVAVARDDDVRPLAAVLERERHPVGALGQAHAAEDELHQLVIAIEAQRELQVLVRHAIEPLEEMRVVAAAFLAHLTSPGV